MWHKQSFTQFWSQSDAYSRRSSLKLTYIHHPLVVCTHQICCAVAVPIALSQDRLLHGHNRLVNWTPCSRMRESKLTRASLVLIMPCPLCGAQLSPVRHQVIIWTNAGCLVPLHELTAVLHLGFGNEGPHQPPPSSVSRGQLCQRQGQFIRY